MAKNPDKAQSPAETEPRVWPWSVALYYGEGDEARQFWAADEEGQKGWVLDRLGDLFQAAKPRLEEGLGVRVVCTVPPKDLEAILDELKIKGLEVGWDFEMDTEAGRVELLAVDPEAALEPLKLIKAAVYIEKAQLGKDRDELIQLVQKHPKQTTLPFGQEGLKERDIVPFGLDLTTGTAKALNAVQALVAESSYQGFYSEEKRLEPWGKVKVVTVACTPSRYLELYGVKRDKNGHFSGKAREDAFKHLKWLDAENQPIAYEQPYRAEDDEILYRLMETNQPIIKLVRGWEGLTEEDRDKFYAGELDPEKASWLYIKLSPAVLDAIEDFYVLKPVDFFQEIETHMNKTPSRAISLFLTYLMLLNRSEHLVGKTKLAHRLRLDGYLRQRKRKVAEERMLEALKTAQGLRYLLKWEDEGKNYRLFPNPERCSRLRGKLQAKSQKALA